MRTFKTLSVAQMPALLEETSALILDCRQVRDYQASHIDNAMHAHDALVESLIKKADKTLTLVIYCYHGHSSEHLAELFCNFGFHNVYSLEGGYEKWSQQTVLEA